MLRIKPTWRSWMRVLSLSALGGVTGALLLWGSGAVHAQQGPIIIHRGPPPSSDPTSQQGTAPLAQPASLPTVRAPTALPTPMPPPLPSQFDPARFRLCAAARTPSGLLNLVPSTHGFVATREPCASAAHEPCAGAAAHAVWLDECAHRPTEHHYTGSNDCADASCQRAEARVTVSHRCRPYRRRTWNRRPCVPAPAPPISGVPLPKLDMQKELNEFVKTMAAPPVAGVPVPTPDEQKEFNHFIKTVVCAAEHARSRHGPNSADGPGRHTATSAGRR